MNVIPSVHSYFTCFYIQVCLCVCVSFLPHRFIHPHKQAEREGVDRQNCHVWTTWNQTSAMRKDPKYFVSEQNHLLDLSPNLAWRLPGRHFFVNRASKPLCFHQPLHYTTSLHFISFLGPSNPHFCINASTFDKVWEWNRARGQRPSDSRVTAWALSHKKMCKMCHVVRAQSVAICMSLFASPLFMPFRQTSFTAFTLARKRSAFWRFHAVPGCPTWSCSWTSCKTAWGGSPS